MPAHPHAELMALYAKDATETDKPWERWECYDPFARKWIPLNGPTAWMEGVRYRRKPERQYYRVGLLKTSDNQYYTCITNNSSTETCWENKLGFDRWLTDRVYYDVE